MAGSHFWGIRGIFVGALSQRTKPARVHLYPGWGGTVFPFAELVFHGGVQRSGGLILQP